MSKDFLEYGMTLDRRKRKTHLAIENALLELMEEKNLESITVSELADKADVNRKTFYNNYSSVEDVFRVIEEKVTNFIFDSLPDKITIENEIEIYYLFLNLVTSMEDKRLILYQVFRIHNKTTLLKRLQEELFPYIENCLLSYSVEPSLIPYINHYVLNGVFSIFEQWFRCEDNLSAKQVSILAYNLTVSAIRLDNYRDLKLSFPVHM